VAVSNCFINDL